MADINMLTLLKDQFINCNGQVYDDPEESSIYFFQTCVNNAVWKDKAEAQAVLEVLIDIADHLSVALADACEIQRVMLNCIVSIAKAAREL